MPQEPQLKRDLSLTVARPHSKLAAVRRSGLQWRGMRVERWKVVRRDLVRMGRLTILPLMDLLLVHVLLTMTPLMDVPPAKDAQAVDVLLSDGSSEAVPLTAVPQKISPPRDHHRTASPP